MGKIVLSRLLDSVILIDHLNGIETATAYVLALNPDETAISVITRAEILAGVAERDEALVKAWLNQFRLINIDRETADLAAPCAGNISGNYPMPSRPLSAVCTISSF